VPSARILRTPEAHQDLLNIWAYIARENATSVADRAVDRIYGALELLAETPLLGRERSEFTGTPRSFSVRPFMIFYEPLSEGDGILVWRIIHGARDLGRVIVRPSS
jgi:toxin ParE1/3/4